MLGRSETVAILGTEAHLVQVEVQVDTGIPGFGIVGLPTRSVTEAEHRTRAGSKSAGCEWPKQRIVANLAPGGLRKDGTHFDLALAIGVMAAAGHIPPDAFDGCLLLGELALDGAVRPVRGVLAAAIAGKDAGRKGIVCPAPNAAEAALVEGIDVIPVTSLRECIELAHGRWSAPPVEPAPPSAPGPLPDMSDVRGHRAAKFAAEVAAAGGHNLLLCGAPGSGKTMLARRIPGVFPELSPAEALEVTRIHSVAGLLGERSSLVTERPFRVPHHHISLAGLIGGGAGLPRPGEISLAHNGTLFLDELTLYRRDVLESLRAPLEDGVVRIARSGGSIAFPCRFSLVAAMNPCPCGYLGDPKRHCRCSERQIQLYEARISGPLLDRFDIEVKMARLTQHELFAAPEGDSSPVVRGRVQAARGIQAERYASDVTTNATAARPFLDPYVKLPPVARELVGAHVDAGRLTGRGVDRVLRVARTLADLRAEETLSDEVVACALQLRYGERNQEVAA